MNEILQTLFQEGQVLRPARSNPTTDNVLPSDLYRPRAMSSSRLLIVGILICARFVDVDVTALVRDFRMVDVISVVYVQGQAVRALRAQGAFCSGLAPAVRLLGLGDTVVVPVLRDTDPDLGLAAPGLLIRWPRATYPRAIISSDRRSACTGFPYSRPFYHFLSSEHTVGYRQDRTVVHDDSLWGGSEPAPTLQIRRADQFHQVLHTIQEAVALSYPFDLAAVFRLVHGDATQNVAVSGPAPLVKAMCNVYQAVFSNLFEDILNGVPLSGLGRRTYRALRSDSPEFQRFVSRVVNDAVVQSVFSTQSTGGPRGPQSRGAYRQGGARQPADGFFHRASRTRVDHDSGKHSVSNSRCSGQTGLYSVPDRERLHILRVQGSPRAPPASTWMWSIG
ncbi:hypothetical protein PC118_g21543 [Phytophthora cactorum]|uniref:Uncharacterized protein n=1 Tax=Phytophthora cactorum TaxID=29920 RepID=A0A8T1F0X2_9STRA|nr:hypothetical protein PC118_g21543 [Phytophthora cactorum]